MSYKDAYSQKVLKSNFKEDLYMLKILICIVMVKLLRRFIEKSYKWHMIKVAFTT